MLGNPNRINNGEYTEGAGNLNLSGKGGRTKNWNHVSSGSRAVILATSNGSPPKGDLRETRKICHGGPRSLWTSCSSRLPPRPRIDESGSVRLTWQKRAGPSSGRDHSREWSRLPATFRQELNRDREHSGAFVEPLHALWDGGDLCPR
jgi:hypothetical protein